MLLIRIWNPRLLRIFDRNFRDGDVSNKYVKAEYQNQKAHSEHDHISPSSLKHNYKIKIATTSEALSSHIGKSAMVDLSTDAEGLFAYTIRDIYIVL